MKHFILFLFAISFLLVSCDEDPAATKKKIEDTSEIAKDLIDVLSDKAKDLAEDKDGDVAKFKDLIKDMSEKSKDLGEILEKEGGDLGKSIDSLTNDPEVKNHFKKLGEDLKKALDQIETEVNKEVDKSKLKETE